MSLLDSIKTIPDRLVEISRNFDKDYNPLFSYIEKKQRTVDEIVFIASGTSYNAAFVSQFLIQKKFNIRVSLYYPNVFLEQKVIINQNALYVCISQSGETIVVERTIQFLKEHNLLNISLTADDHSSIAQAADIHLNMRAGVEEYVFRTVGYSCSAVCCCLIGICLAYLSGKISRSRVEYYLTDLVQAADNIQSLIETSSTWFMRNRNLLADKKAVFFAGESLLWAVSQEAEIKFMEMLPVVSTSFEIEEMIHGPQNAFDDKIQFFLLYKAKTTSDKTLKIGDFINKEIGRAVMIGDQVLAPGDLAIQVQSRYFYFLEYVSVVQTLAFHYSIAKGRDLSRRINSEVDHYITKAYQS